MIVSITLLFFGAARDAVGKAAEHQMTFSYPVTATKIVERAKQTFSGLGGLQLQVAVNERHATADTLVVDGDVVAVFTAVSGG